MSKHTPGPWHWDNGQVIDDTGRILLVNGVSMPTGNHPRDDEASANARLIAASPALLAACEAALPWLEGSFPPPTHEGSCTPESGCDAGCMELAAASRVFNQVRAAIAAAKGKPS